MDYVLEIEKWLFNAGAQPPYLKFGNYEENFISFFH